MSSVATLGALKEPKHPFEPPTPVPGDAADTALAVGAGIGVIALDIVTGGFLSGLNAIPSLSRDHDEPIDLAPLLATIADTAAPIDDGEGNAQCTRCAQLVPYATMSLNEDGYFCAACATAVVRETLGDP